MTVGRSKSNLLSSRDSFCVGSDKAPSYNDKRCENPPPVVSLSVYLGVTDYEVRKRKRGQGVRKYDPRCVGQRKEVDYTLVQEKVLDRIRRRQEVSMKFVITRSALNEDGIDSKSESVRPEQIPSSGLKLSREFSMGKVLKTTRDSSTQSDFVFTVASGVSNDSLLNNVKSAVTKGMPRPSIHTSQLPAEQAAKSNPNVKPDESSSIECVSKSSPTLKGYTPQRTTPNEPPSVQGPAVGKQFSPRSGSSPSTETPSLSSSNPATLPQTAKTALKLLVESCQVSGTSQRRGSDQHAFMQRPVAEVTPKVTELPAAQQPQLSVNPSQVQPIGLMCMAEEHQQRGRDAAPDEYMKALNWKPSTEKQAELLKQLKTDLYQVLLVGKGCKLWSIKKEFLRVVQEDLVDHLRKIGLPDVNSLLVQLHDLIHLKRDVYSGEIYVYPNMSHRMFEQFAHIGELVAEQRSPLFQVVPHPSSSNLTDQPIRSLFEKQSWRQPSQQPAWHYSQYNNPTGQTFYSQPTGMNNDLWNYQMQYQQLYQYYLQQRQFAQPNQIRQDPRNQRGLFPNPYQYQNSYQPHNCQFS